MKVSEIVAGAVARWVGPIPSVPDAPVYASDARQIGDRIDGTDAPAGPRPAWGPGWRPQRALPHAWGPYTAGEIPAVWADLPRERDELVRGWGRDLAEEEWWAHSAPTLLLLREGAWWVGCPARPCQRVVDVLRDAARAGAKISGALPEELAYVAAYPRHAAGNPPLYQTEMSPDEGDNGDFKW